GNELRGSARSIPGLHIRDVLATVDARNPGLLGRFGGHAMAAGLSLPGSHLEAFRDAFRACVEEFVDPAMLPAELLRDGELSPDELCHASALALRDGGPWGQGFPEPQFDGELEVLGWRQVGERHVRRERAAGGEHRVPTRARRLPRRRGDPAGGRAPRTRLSTPGAPPAAPGHAARMAGHFPATNHGHDRTQSRPPAHRRPAGPAGSAEGVSLTTTPSANAWRK